MGKHAIRGVLGFIPVLFVIVSLSFFVVRSAPGGPFAQERALPKEVIANMEAKYGLDRPILVQYLRYLAGLLRGDLGLSTAYVDYDVSFYLRTAFPASLLLGTITIILSLLTGVTAGMLAALNGNRWPDYLVMGLAILGLSVPIFVLGPLLISLFSLKLHWLPTSGWLRDGGAKTLILPTLSFAFYYFGIFARLSRGSMTEVLQSDYIRTARAKGLPASRVIWRHALPGAMVPVMSYLGPAFAGVVTGSIVIESIFRVPGVGHYFVQSALNRDYFLLLGTVILYAVTLMIMNFLVDLSYSLLDPRVSYERKH